MTSRVSRIQRCARCDADEAATTGEAHPPTRKKPTWICGIRADSATGA